MQNPVNDAKGGGAERELRPETPADASGLPAEELSSTPAETAAECLSGLELAALRAKAAERDELWDRLLRTQADFDNWRKRLERESRASVRFSVQEIVQELLPVLDNLERALKSVDEAHDPQAFHEGMHHVHRQFLDVLRANDVIPIEAVGGKFDPSIHEAVAVLRTKEHPPFTVLEEVAKGFRMHDRVLRPAQVVVSAAEEQPQKDETNENATGQ